MTSLLIGGGSVLVATAKVSPKTRHTIEEKFTWTKQLFRAAIGPRDEVGHACKKATLLFRGVLLLLKFEVVWLSMENFFMCVLCAHGLVT